MMRHRANLFLIAAAITAWCTSQTARSAVPVPEFFGVYVVVDGKAIELPEALAQKRLRPQRSGPMTLVRYGISTLSDVAAKPDSYFLFFGPDFAPAATEMLLFSLGFISTTQAETFSGMESLQADFWGGRDRIPVKVGPVAGQPDLFRIVPVAPLADGPYALSGSAFGGSTFEGMASDFRGTYDFYVGPKPSSSGSGHPTADAGRGGTTPQTPVGLFPSSAVPLAFPDVVGTWAGSIVQIDSEKTWDARMSLKKPESGFGYEGTYTDSGAKCDFFVKSGTLDGKGLWFETVGGDKFSCRLMKGKMRFVLASTGPGQLELLMYISDDKPKYRAILVRPE